MSGIAGTSTPPGPVPARLRAVAPDGNARGGCALSTRAGAGAVAGALRVHAQAPDDEAGLPQPPPAQRAGLATAGAVAPQQRQHVRDVEHAATLAGRPCPDVT